MLHTDIRTDVVTRMILNHKTEYPMVTKRKITSRVERYINNHDRFCPLQFFPLKVFDATPSKSMPQKSNHTFKGKYPYIRAGTLKPMRMKDILTKNRFFAVLQCFRIRVRHIMT